MQGTIIENPPTLLYEIPISLAIPRVLKLGVVSTISSTISSFNSVRKKLPFGMFLGEQTMSRSPPDRMPFGVQPDNWLDRCNLAPCARIISAFLRSCTLSSNSQSVCDGNKASFQRTPSYRSVPLAANSTRNGNFAYSAFNTLSLKFSPRTFSLYSLPRHLQFLGYV
ncbi:hypothetical protein TNCV_4750581 [Trichonephila clavipes]|nr:hypothetical protein TNCV_4750581 [Trichonephila clavipes]